MIIVFGSIYMDMLLLVKSLPGVSETVLSHDYTMMPGGKGANQAFAAGRMNEHVALVGKVGDDGMGYRIKNKLRRIGVLTTGIGESEALSTGCVVVLSNNKGDNQSVVAVGANSEASEDQIPDEILDKNTLLLLQMDLDHNHNWELIKRAKKNEARIILNLSPFGQVPKEILSQIDYLILNEHVLSLYSEHLGFDAHDTLVSARSIAQMGQLDCIVTLGKKGSLAVLANGKDIHVPALTIEDVVDTTYAGDSYCGTFAAAIYAGKEIEEAMNYASIAASLSCLRQGGMDSFVYLDEIQVKVKELNSK